MDKLNTQTKNFAVVIGQYDKGTNKRLSVSYVNNCLESFRFNYDCDYFSILHDRDINEDGELKNPHFHIVLKFKAKHRLCAVLNKLMMELDISKDNISIEKCNSLRSSIRYLTHIDYDGFKTQYNTEECYYSDKTIFDGAFADFEKKGLDSNYLIKCVYSASNVIELVQMIGTNNYVRYHKLISDLGFFEMATKKTLDKYSERLKRNGSLR